MLKASCSLAWGCSPKKWVVSKIRILKGCWRAQLGFPVSLQDTNCHDAKSMAEAVGYFVRCLHHLLKLLRPYVSKRPRQLCISIMPADGEGWLREQAAEATAYFKASAIFRSS